MERPCTRLSRFICDIRLASDTWISNVKNVLCADKEKDGLHIWSSVMGLKVIPQYCIAHPYCARFLASIARAHSARTLTTWRFLYETKLNREIKGHFQLNEHGDLSFSPHDFGEIIIFFELNEF